MIELHGISKTFNKGNVNEVQALHPLDTVIADGDFMVITGTNGSGKSTLLNMLAGSVSPDSGTVKFDNVDVSRLKDFERSKWIARVFQNPLAGTAPGLSIIDNFRLAALRTKPKDISIGVTLQFEKDVKERLASLGLGLQDKVHQLMGTLSGGQRQALTLLMSVMDNCKILLLDEPTAALDPRSAEVVMKTAEQIIIQYGLTTIMVTHNLKEAYNYGNRLVHMNGGKIVKDLNTGEKKLVTQNEIFEWFT